MLFLFGTWSYIRKYPQHSLAESLLVTPLSLQEMMFFFVGFYINKVALLLGESLSLLPPSNTPKKAAVMCLAQWNEGREEAAMQPRVQGGALLNSVPWTISAGVEGAAGPTSRYGDINTQLSCALRMQDQIHLLSSCIWVAWPRKMVFAPQLVMRRTRLTPEGDLDVGWVCP